MIDGKTKPVDVDAKAEHMQRDDAEGENKTSTDDGYAGQARQRRGRVASSRGSTRTRLRLPPSLVIASLVLRRAARPEHVMIGPTPTLTARWER